MTPSFAPSRLALATLCAVLLAACGSSKHSTSASSPSPDRPGAGKPPVVMGDKNFPEQLVLGQLYKQALEAKGYTVRMKDNIGASEIVDRALVLHSIDVYPEYTGVIVQELEGSAARLRSAAQAYREAKAYEEKRGFTLLAPTPFEDKDALAVTRRFARRHGGLRAVPELRGLGRLTLGAPPESQQREAGVKGLREVYGLTNLQFMPMEIGQQYRALDRGSVDVANVFTTDGRLQTGRYTVLSDPKNVFGFQNVAPVISRRKLEALGPEFRAVMDRVSATLTTPAMQRMNAAVTLRHQAPAAVARRFLRSQGLV